jgi:hypothetical protein
MEGFLCRRKGKLRSPQTADPSLRPPAFHGAKLSEFARADVAWIDSRHGSAQSSLPPVDVLPVPDILYRLPYLHENRPRGSKAMLDAAGARARLRDVRPGAWLISPFSGWKWAKWPSGDVGWLPPDIELPATLKVAARNDMQNAPSHPDRRDRGQLNPNLRHQLVGEVARFKVRQHGAPAPGRDDAGPVLSDLDVGSVQKDPALTTEQPKQDGDPLTPWHAGVDREVIAERTA